MNLVQVDAVVTDAKGRHISDLRPADFEIYQDGRRQEITHFAYVETPGAPAPLRPVSIDKTAPPPPPQRLRPEQVRRTVALVVDDLGLSFESTAYVIRALRKFVDEELQPGDLAAVIRAAAGIGALQQFTADKRMLHAAIDRIRWSPFGRQSVSFRLAPAGETEFAQWSRDAENRFADFQRSAYSLGSLGALQYVLRGLSELPGRKSVVLFSDGLPLFTIGEGVDTRLIEVLRKVTELANRSSAVIYTVHARGLATLSLGASERFDPGVSLIDVMNDRRKKHFESQDGLNLLAAETGGLFFKDRNDLDRATAEAFADQSGYYLIGYNPGAETFALDKGRPKDHRIKVVLKRPGLRLRSRTGFQGVADADAHPKPRTPAEQLMAAMASPFTSGDIRLKLTCIFRHAEKTGSVMYALLHVDPHGLTFTDDATEGWKKAVIDIAVATFGDNGIAVDQSARRYSVRVRSDALPRLLEDGIIYSIRHPLKKPGAYQLRAALRDAASERVGSATQFVDVPDVKKGRIALSGFFMWRLQEETAKALSAGGAAEAVAEGRVEAPDARGGPALRMFQAGNAVFYAFEIYNAHRDSKTRLASVQTRMRLFRDNKEIWAGAPNSLSGRDQTGPRTLVAAGMLKLGAKMEPGEYVLQAITMDTLAKPKDSIATQWIDFELLAP